MVDFEALALVLLCDLPAMLFVLALILRQTARATREHASERPEVYMLVNVTTYEVLVCPPHVCSRFPRRLSVSSARFRTQARRELLVFGWLQWPTQSFEKLLTLNRLALRPPEPHLLLDAGPSRPPSSYI